MPVSKLERKTRFREAKIVAGFLGGAWLGIGLGATAYHFHQSNQPMKSISLADVPTSTGLTFAPSFWEREQELWRQEYDT